MRAPVVKRSYLAVLMLALGVYCYLGVVQAAMLYAPGREREHYLAAEIWLGLSCLFVIVGGAIGVSAWRLNRRLSREERASPGERR